MTPLSTKLKELRTVAEKATPGPWVWRSLDGLCNKYIEYGVVLAKNEDDSFGAPSIENAAHIKAFNPEVVMKLITALEECVAELDMAADYFIALKKTNMCIGVDERHVDGNCAYCEYDHAASQFSRSLSRINSLFPESGERTEPSDCFVSEYKRGTEDGRRAGFQEAIEFLKRHDCGPWVLTIESEFKKRFPESGDGGAG